MHIIYAYHLCVIFPTQKTAYKGGVEIHQVISCLESERELEFSHSCSYVQKALQQGH